MPLFKQRGPMESKIDEALRREEEARRIEQDISDLVSGRQGVFSNRLSLKEEEYVTDRIPSVRAGMKYKDTILNLCGGCKYFMRRRGRNKFNCRLAEIDKDEQFKRAQEGSCSKKEIGEYS